MARRSTGWMVVVALALVAGGIAAAWLWQVRPDILQKPGSVPRIAYLSVRTVAYEQPFLEDLVRALKGEGLERGRHYVIDVWAEGDQKRAVALLARERALAGDAILYGPTRSPALAAAATGAATVFNFYGDFFQELKEYAAAGNPPNATGVNVRVPVLARRLELLAQVLGPHERIALLWDQTVPDEATDREITALSPEMRARVHVVMVGEGELPTLGMALRARGARGVYVPMHRAFFENRGELVASLNAAGLPTMFEASEFTRAGGLFSVQGDHAFRTRRLARVMAAVLGGTPPARIPIDRPKELVFEVNLRTASQLGLPLSRDLLAQANTYIQ